MTNVTLSAAVRSSLLSLQNTTVLIDRTQNRLSSGLRVASAVDDPVSFFQAKTLNDRAFDFSEKKDGIDQGVSTVSAALQGIEAIESIVRQLKGIASSLRSATGTQFSDLVTQFNSLRTQIGNLADDATFQGVNLVNNTTETLTVSFSDRTQSLLTVEAVNVRESGLGVGAAIHGSGVASGLFNYAANTSNNALNVAETITVTYQGTARTLDTASTLTFSYGSVSIAVKSNTAGSQTISAGDVLTLTLASDAAEDAVRKSIGTSGIYGEIALAGVAGLTFEFAANTSNLTLSANETITVTYQGSQRTLDTASALSFSYGSLTINVKSNTAFSQTITLGQTLTLTLASDAAEDATRKSIGTSGIYGEIALAGVIGPTFEFAKNTATTFNALSAGDTITVTYQGSAQAVDSASVIAFTYGTLAVLLAGRTAAAVNLSAGDVITLTIQSAVGSAGAAANASIGVATSIFFGIVAQNGLDTGTLVVADAAVIAATGIDLADVSAGVATGIVVADVTANVDNIVVEGKASTVNAAIDKLDSALVSLRSNAQTLGSNVALLQTRLDFTTVYVNTLETGSAKLTLADINEEGANLLALQTRQQLGISALAFAGQAEQGILSLFR